VRIAEFVRALPKAELHLHVEGAVPWALVRARSPSALPERPPWWGGSFRFRDFDHFREAARLCLAGLGDPDAHHAAARAIFDDLRAQDVRYVEISFDVVRVAARGLALGDIVAAVASAVPSGLTARVFGAFSYHKAGRTPDALVDAVLATPGLHGVDLHGDETHRTAARFAGAFRRAREAGLVTKAHAGELAGPDSIGEALDRLGVRRIEHGVRAVEDERLLGRLVAEAVTLDLCPWSNWKLGLTGDAAAHPIGRLHRRGVAVTVSTDDPTLFGRSLTEELVALAEGHGFTGADLARLQANAFRAADLPGDARAEVLERIDALAAACEGGGAPSRTDGAIGRRERR
jgi:adenosine deaminase